MSKRTPIPRDVGDVVVYDGQKWLGTISRRLGRFRAVDVNGRVLGAYGTAAEARRAILAMADDGGAP
jgi:hypothetical protein